MRDEPQPDSTPTVAIEHLPVAATILTGLLRSLTNVGADLPHRPLPSWVMSQATRGLQRLPAPAPMTFKPMLSRLIRRHGSVEPLLRGSSVSDGSPPSAGPDDPPRTQLASSTGFRPADQVSPAPTTVPDARAAFAAAAGREGGVEVKDPQVARTEPERLAERAVLEEIVKAQREGEALSGFLPRK